MGLLLWIDSINATKVQNKDDNDDSTSVKILDNDQDDAMSLLDKRATEHNNQFRDAYPSIMLGKHRFGSRGVRLPAESILLGKRRLPVESILLGKRRLPVESILLGKRRLPVEAVLLGRRSLPDEDAVHSERR
ncbi:unnamed protein product [Rotaria sordida]|uniref:Uncharacterized protein n=1 Tax=Rotaria sordida TaxID=392033 RepID=A0A813VLC5_9BILA|nr:unnamed protein product [Rotaria sordida]CAF0844918.1 unnamed protein product [Rotaria sordida]CAF0845978.1 unnamed protein product [Rotaria sordida]